jgi:hypothetical protein
LIIAGLAAAGVELIAELGIDTGAAIVGSTIYLAIVFGIHRMSRAAAVLGLLLYLCDRMVMSDRVGLKGWIGLVASIIILMFVNSIRGTVAYRRLTSVGSPQRFSGTQTDGRAHGK